MMIDKDDYVILCKERANHGAYDYWLIQSKNGQEYAIVATEEGQDEPVYSLRGGCASLAWSTSIEWHSGSGRIISEAEKLNNGGRRWTDFVSKIKEVLQ